VELLPVAALLRAGHQLRVALGGHDAACFDRYGPSGETFTVQLGERSTLDLPILASGASATKIQKFWPRELEKPAG
jgi:predicted acyl esterase